MENKKTPDYETIMAAKAGDKKAIENIVAHYSDYIDSLAKGDEDVRQQLIMKLIEGIPEFETE